MKKILFILIGSVLFYSCQEETQVNLISGQLFSECNVPLGNTEIALRANVTGSFSEPIILGTAITSANGGFNFTYELEEDESGTGNLLLIEKQGFQTLISNLKLNVDQTVDLVVNDSSSLIVKLGGSKAFGASDTLYYGLLYNSQEYFRVMPSNGSIDTFYFDLPNSTNGKTSTNLYYGVGSVDFKRAKGISSNSDSTFNKKTFNLTICSETATTVTIN